MQKEQTQTQAQEILERIQSYWAQKGFQVQGAVHPAGYSPRLRSTVYEVTTDLVNGLPRRMNANH